MSGPLSAAPLNLEAIIPVMPLQREHAISCRPCSSSSNFLQSCATSRILLTAFTARCNAIYHHGSELAHSSMPSEFSSPDAAWNARFWPS